MRLVIVFTALLTFLLTSPAHAGLFDRPKDPAAMMLNQKDCTYMKTYRGKTVNGEFIRPDRWVGSKFSIGEPTIIANFKRLDEKTAHFTNVNNIGDGQGVRVYVGKTTDALEARLSDGSLILVCHLNK
jgi:hypothetical protein